MLKSSESRFSHATLRAGRWCSIEFSVMTSFNQVSPRNKTGVFFGDGGIQFAVCDDDEGRIFYLIRSSTAEKTTQWSPSASWCHIGPNRACCIIINVLIRESLNLYYNYYNYSYLFLNSWLIYFLSTVGVVVWQPCMWGSLSKSYSMLCSLSTTNWNLEYAVDC